MWESKGSRVCSVFYSRISGVSCCQQREGAAFGCVGPCVRLAAELTSAVPSAREALTAAMCHPGASESQKRRSVEFQTHGHGRGRKADADKGWLQFTHTCMVPGGWASRKMFDSCSQSAETTERRSSRLEEERDFIMQQPEMRAKAFVLKDCT